MAAGHAFRKVQAELQQVTASSQAALHHAPAGPVRTKGGGTGLKSALPGDAATATHSSTHL